MFEGSFSNEYSPEAIEAEHREYRKDLEYKNELFWKGFPKLIVIFGLIIAFLIALDQSHNLFIS